ncbi:hypothetical protein BDV95DRAFT_601682 [Massariosphaeria phaeospora]|uniref:ATP synthase subunit K, mitochondrial n=1 Tax=Massariosphaeria phaeospora TaxID=100035 RepID=A0A7C8IHG2_9PLEO|nr:hypothetical protein BDV95DRAFT_601682 [Massariosphaeria phaeospora]
MVAMYTIFGRQVGSHVLAMATLGTLGAGVVLSLGGSSSKKADASTPPLNAKSKEEESFIKDFVRKAEGEKK